MKEDECKEGKHTFKGKYAEEQLKTHAGEKASRRLTHARITSDKLQG